MSFHEHLREHRRLVILRCLSELPTHRTNTSVLLDAVNHYGVASTRDDVRTDVAWLAEQGLVRVEALTDHVQLAVLTERGADVAAGRAFVPGVRKPGPR